MDAMTATEKAQRTAQEILCLAIQGDSVVTRLLVDEVLQKGRDEYWGGANVRTVFVWVRKYASHRNVVLALTEREIRNQEALKAERAERVALESRLLAVGGVSVEAAESEPPAADETPSKPVAGVTYASVRRFLGRTFPLSRTASNGRRWSEGVRVQTLAGGDVVVTYAENHANFYSDGSCGVSELEAVREHLRRRYDVADYGPSDGGRLLVTRKSA
ncbi:hypothetical protein [Kitasatospora sp. NPDC101183]|uniref:hypothetical protein n=1 Tax=Kitasatospora sp. NPDC101183 TaxID=3364100 RepID=UPI003813E0FD